MLNQSIAIIKQIAISFILVACMFLAVACGNGNSRDFYFPGLQSAAEGGGTVAYGITHNRAQTDLYLCRLRSDGTFQWQTLLWSGYIQGQNPLLIVSNGNSDSIVAWSGYSSSQVGTAKLAGKVIKLARVNQEGKVIWEREVEDFNNIDILVGDGNGGAFLADIEDIDLDNVLLQRIDAEGKLVWSRQIKIAGSIERYGTLKMVGDGDGGIILFKRVINNIASDKFDILAQRIDSQGKDLWVENGISLYLGSRDTTINGVVTDNSHGAIVVWTDTGVKGVPGRALFAQRIAPDGAILWQEGGNLVNVSDTNVIPSTLQGADPVDIMLSEDGTGNVIVLWESNLSIFVQKLSSAGNVLWEEGGIQVESGDPTVALITSTLAGDSEGGAIISWVSVTQAGRRLFIQKIDASGRIVFPEEAMVTTHKNVYPFRIVASSDGLGGLLVSWGTGKGNYDITKTFIQKISSEGIPVWGKNGIELSP